jgi:tetratricopeptide (TPR) repeat protein
VGRAPNRSIAFLVAAIAVVAGGSANAAKSKGKLPNLVESKVSKPPASLAVGQSFEVKDTAHNAGDAKAGASDTRYYLTENAKQSQRNRVQSKTNPRTSPTDILLVGFRHVKRLGPSAASSGKTSVHVPGGTPAGRYYLLACADDRGVVRESKEGDNCSVGGKTQVTPVSGPQGRLEAFSDTKPPLDPQEAPVVTPLLQAFCAGPKKPEQMTLAKAVSTADAYLTKTAGADAMAAFKASADYHSVPKLEGSAAGAMAAKSPGAALAALLRAHELEPHEASHLLNAAGAAAAIGLPNEALAFLDAAETLDLKKRLPMGISPEAASLATRGYALYQLGKYAEAETALKEALSISPVLSEEASTTLAAVKACRGKDPIPAYKTGRWRQNPPPPLDDSQGKVTEFRHFPFPALPVNAAANADFYKTLDDTESARSTAEVNKISQLQTQLNQVLASKNLATQERTQELLNLGYSVGQADDLKALDATLETKTHAANNAIDALFGQGGQYQQFISQAFDACVDDPDPDACFAREMRSRCIPAAKLTHQEWLNDLNVAYGAAQQYMRIASKRISAIASHFKTDAAYQLLMQQVVEDDLVMYGLFAQSAMFWSGPLAGLTDPNDGRPYCVETPEPEPVQDPGDVAPQGSNPCPPGLQSFSASLELGFATVEANCNELTVGVESEGWIAGFAEVSFDFKEGSATIFAGAKGEVGLGPVKGDFKSGLALKCDADGPQGLAWRVGPSYTVSAGPAHFGGSDYEDITIVGSMGGPGI